MDSLYPVYVWRLYRKDEERRIIWARRIITDEGEINEWNTERIAFACLYSQWESEFTNGGKLETVWYEISDARPAHGLCVWVCVRSPDPGEQ